MDEVTDNTGTLTEGVIRVAGSNDADGASLSDVLGLAACNAALETGLDNPLDDAIAIVHPIDRGTVGGITEIPVGLSRKRVTVVVARDAAGRRHPRARREQAAFSRSDERDMTFAGFLTFLDAPKAGIDRTIGKLPGLGVEIKVVAGDNGRVARHIAGLVGLRAERVLTGRELDALHDEALWHVVKLTTNRFVEVDPNQKERIIPALKKTGHVVGLLGDGVNDAPALHAADTSLSVERAVDVARAAADFVLFEPRLPAVCRGIAEGRRTFANTLKCVSTTTSTNLGHGQHGPRVAGAALSAAARFSNPVNNFLSDIPGARVWPTIASMPSWSTTRGAGACVSSDRSMVVFGLISSNLRCADIQRTWLRMPRVHQTYFAPAGSSSRS